MEIDNLEEASTTLHQAICEVFQSIIREIQTMALNFNNNLFVYMIFT